MVNVNVVGTCEDDFACITIVDLDALAQCRVAIEREWFHLRRNDRVKILVGLSGNVHVVRMCNMTLLSTLIKVNELNLDQLTL